MAASTVCRWVQNVQPKGWPRTGNRKFSDEMRTFVTEMIRRRPCKKPVTDEVAGVGKFTVPAVVKMKFATFVKDDGVLKYIQTLPPLVNRLEGEAYAFGNFYLLRLMNDANAELPVIDHKFYNKCIIAVATNNARDSTLTQSWRDAIVAFDLHRPLDGRPKVDITGSIFNQIVGTLSKKMATMATNHLTMNLAPRLWVYLGWKYPHLHPLSVRLPISRHLQDRPQKNIWRITQSRLEHLRRALQWRSTVLYCTSNKYFQDQYSMSRSPGFGTKSVWRA
jgi:hypothetical protein